MKSEIEELNSNLQRTKQDTEDATALIEQQGETIEELESEMKMIKQMKD